MLGYALPILLPIRYIIMVLQECPTILILSTQGYLIMQALMWAVIRVPIQFVPEIGADLYMMLFGMGLSVNTHAITPRYGAILD